MIMKTIAVIGLGNRGTEYMRFVKHFYSSKAKIVALCDVNGDVLKKLAPVYKIEDSMLFNSADDFFSKGKIADAVIISTQDKTHYEIAKKALLCGYHILLEKPVSESVKECEELKNIAEKKGLYLMVCHVLRYSNVYKKIKSVLCSGVLGKIISIDHTENVGYFHFAHSFVRGNWRNTSIATPSILAKCCHDLDLISWYAESPCKEVVSYGDVTYFNKDHAPEGATERCLNGCKVKDSCPYDAEALYITDPFWRAKFIKYLKRTVTGKLNASKADVYEALASRNYGKCVFLSDNNVKDYQTVMMRFENGITAVHHLNAFSDKMYRNSRFICEKGELVSCGNKLTLKLFGKRNRNLFTCSFLAGHIEGDFFTIKSFVKLLNGEKVDLENLTFIDKTIESHKIAMAAEKSANEGGSKILL